MRTTRQHLVRPVLPLLTILCVGVLAACGSSSSSSTTAAASDSPTSTGATRGPFVLLWIGALSGQTQLIGQAQLHGTKAAIAYVNAHGGMAGQRVELIVKDDGGAPTTAVTDLVSYLGSNAPPAAVFAGSESTETGALFPVLARRKVFGYAETDEGLLAANASEKFPYEFNPGRHPSTYDLAAAQWFKARNVRKVGILQEALDYTTAETPLIAAELRQKGIGSTVATFPATLTDLTPEMSKLKSAGADAVYLETLGPADGYALSARTKLGWNAPALGDAAFSAIDVTKLVPASDIKNVYLLAAHESVANSNYPAITLFKTYIAHAGGINGAGLASTSTPWDDLLTVYTAARQAGTTTPAALTTAMEHMRHPAQPYYVGPRSEGFSASDHENVYNVAGDQVVIPVGPFTADGQVATR